MLLYIFRNTGVKESHDVFKLNLMLATLFRDCYLQRRIPRVL